MIFTHIEDNLHKINSLLTQDILDTTTLEIIETVKSILENRVTSTSADLLEWSGYLYNVKGSTPDPKKVKGYEGLSWKQLLIEKSKKESGNINQDSKCYSPDNVKGYSHDQFDLGGHMTTSADGSAMRGPNNTEECFLIPWCCYHNSKSNDSMQHFIEKKQVLLLRNYEGKTPVIFQALLAVKKKTIVFLCKSDNGWKISEFESEDDANILKYKVISNNSLFVVFEKRPIV